MQQGYRYIDADSHILEPLDLWERYLEPEYRSEMPYTFVGYTGDPLAFTVKVIIGEYGMPYSHEGSSSPLPGLADVYMSYVNQGFTPECYTDAMARVGMDYMVLYPTAGLYFVSVPKLAPATAAAYCRAYNNWLHDFASVGGGRLIGAAKVDLRDPLEAAREARRCVEDFGFRAITINPEPVTEHRLNSTFYDPLWDQLEDLDIPVGVHVGAGNAAEQWVKYYFPEQSMLQASATTTFAIGNQLVAMTMILGGVLERHPKLRVVHLESGCGWAAYWLDRMESSVQGGTRGLMPEGLTISPMEYFQRQCYISCDTDDPGIKMTMDVLGDGNIVTSTDFGHPEGRRWVHAMDDLRAQPVSDDAKRKMAWDNGNALYKIKVD